MLVGLGLFVITVPLVHTRLNNISNVFIVTMGVLALVCVYFFTEPGEAGRSEPVAGYAQSVFQPSAQSSTSPGIEYRGPVRLDVDEKGMAVYSQLAYCAFMIVLLHVFLFIAMGDLSFRSFWRYWHIVVFALMAWGALFYATGVPALANRCGYWRGHIFRAQRDAHYRHI